MDRRAIRDEAPILVSIGSGAAPTGFDGWESLIGEVVWARWRDQNSFESREGPVLILDATREYFHEDGWSFGVGDESGYAYTAFARPATDAEAEDLLKRRAAGLLRQNAATLVEAALRAPRPKTVAPAAPASEIIELSTSDLRLVGHRDFAVIEPAETPNRRILLAQYRGGDGDAWGEGNFGTNTSATEQPWTEALDNALHLVAEGARPAPAGGAG